MKSNSKNKRKKYDKLRLKANKSKRRYFVNPTCIICKRKYHINVNNKDDWKSVNLKKYVCILCRKSK
jgi:hypothetical protein